jgi:gluconate kinase
MSVVAMKRHLRDLLRTALKQAMFVWSRISSDFVRNNVIISRSIEPLGQSVVECN